jgi:hypothetical protein
MSGRGKWKYSEKSCSITAFSTTNPRWPVPGSNPGRCGGKLATNSLSSGPAKSHMQVYSWSDSLSLTAQMEKSKAPSKKSDSRFWDLSRCRTCPPSPRCEGHMTLNIHDSKLLLGNRAH